jgi:hypothetical protein
VNKIFSMIENLQMDYRKRIRRVKAKIGMDDVKEEEGMAAEEKTKSAPRTQSPPSGQQDYLKSLTA